MVVPVRASTLERAKYCEIIEECTEKHIRVVISQLPCSQVHFVFRDVCGPIASFGSDLCRTSRQTLAVHYTARVSNDGGEVSTGFLAMDFFLLLLFFIIQVCSKKDAQTDKIYEYLEPMPEAVGRLTDAVAAGLRVHKLILMDTTTAIDRVRPMVEKLVGEEATLTQVRASKTDIEKLVSGFVLRRCVDDSNFPSHGRLGQTGFALLFFFSYCSRESSVAERRLLFP